MVLQQRKHRRLPRPPAPEKKENEIRISTTRNKRIPKQDPVADSVALFEVITSLSSLQ